MLFYIEKQHNINAYISLGWKNDKMEFWLGLQNIHCLTLHDNIDTMIDLMNNGMTWIYDHLKLSGSDDHYHIDVGRGSELTDGYDAMAHINCSQFTTQNSDHDKVHMPMVGGTTMTAVMFKSTGVPSRGVWWYEGSRSVTSQATTA